MNRCSNASTPSRASAISPLTLPTAVCDPLAAEARAAVAQLDRLVLARRRARRHRGPAGGAGVEDHLDLDGRVATGIEDLTADDGDDVAHESGRLCAGAHPPTQHVKFSDSAWRSRAHIANSSL